MTKWVWWVLDRDFFRPTRWIGCGFSAGITTTKGYLRPYLSKSHVTPEGFDPYDKEKRFTLCGQEIPQDQTDCRSVWAWGWKFSEMYGNRDDGETYDGHEVTKCKRCLKKLAKGEETND